MKIVFGSDSELKAGEKKFGKAWIKSIRPALTKVPGGWNIDQNHPAYLKAEHKLIRKSWPRAVKLLAYYEGPNDSGVGDTVKRWWKRIGAESIAAIFTTITGIDCGCADEVKELNRMFPYENKIQKDIEKNSKKDSKKK